MRESSETDVIDDEELFEGLEFMAVGGTAYVGRSVTAAETDDSDNLAGFTEEELGLHFDELADIALNQPEDALVTAALTRIVRESNQRGDIDLVMRMAMTLGAMACLDDHFEDLAREAGRSLEDGHGANDGHEHHKNDKHDTHDPKKCPACRAGRPCGFRR